MKHANHAIWFERHINPAPIFPDVAIATLTPIPKVRFALNLPGALAAARWRSQPGENFDAFRERIRRDLAAEGVHGVLVSIYERGAHFERNAAFATISEPAA